ncbi:MAG: CRTAC1 family protein [Planctomycetes bacterium]|nr:CRTAC1 family protein [Planctomycetota bacterium]
MARTAAHHAATVALVGMLGLVWWLGHPDLYRERGGASSEVGFRMEEVSAASGLVFSHREAEFDAKIRNVMPHVAGVGASASVADFDADGHDDLYVTSSAAGAPNALFRNRGDGSFEDVAVALGVAECNSKELGASMGSIWGDLDNDGFEELLVYKYGKLQLFQNHGGKRFEDVTKVSGLLRHFNSNAAVFFDYDRDGLLDLYVAGYFSEKHDLYALETTKIMQNSFEFATNGGHNALFRNEGGLRFRDVTAETASDCERWTLAVGSADFDGNGYPDLYLANDYGPEVLLLNRRGKRFEPAEDVGLSDTSKSGMAVAMGDVRNRGAVDVYVTNISKKGFLFQGNNLRLNLLGDPRSRMRNVAEGDVADAGWSWGAQFGDFDNDGALDIFVANGFISGNPKKDYWYDMGRVAGGVNATFEDATSWAPIADRTLSGYERSRVLHNDGQGDFADVAEAVGVTDLLDGRAVSVADFAHRGALDVAVANQRERLLLYRAVAPSEHDWIQIRLVGAAGARGGASNRSAIGASIVLEWENAKNQKLRQVRVVDGGCGMSSQNSRAIHFGLGANARILRATIRWPSGREQILTEGLAPRTLRVVQEPSL